MVLREDREENRGWTCGKIVDVSERQRTEHECEEERWEKDGIWQDDEEEGLECIQISTIIHSCQSWQNLQRTSYFPIVVPRCASCRKSRRRRGLLSNWYNIAIQ